MEVHVSRRAKLISAAILLCVGAGSLAILAIRSHQPDVEVERYPEDISEAEARRMTAESVKTLPPKIYKTSELDEKTIQSLPGMTGEQRKKVWERVKAMQEGMHK